MSVDMLTKVSAMSVKDRLKNLAKKENTTIQNELITYALERTIYRMSISQYKEFFTLKGGIFLYALFERNFPRATMDIDLLANKMINDAKQLKEVFCCIFSIECNDALFFDLSSLQTKNITEFKDYHGVNVSIIAYLDKTKIPVSIDIGFGDLIYLDRVEMDFPVLLDMEIPKIYAYSIYSVIAEKFEAFVSLGYLNSRFKDFYDIYIISDMYDLNGYKLTFAIENTFKHRKTNFDDIVAFTNDFINDYTRESEWK